jgi:hypothetical protein
MSESEIDIVIKCKCGNLLTETKRETESRYGDRLIISVEPCEDCLEDSFEDGIESAWEDGFEGRELKEPN